MSESPRHRIVFEIQYNNGSSDEDFKTIGRGVGQESSMLDDASYLAHLSIENGKYDDE